MILISKPTIGLQSRCWRGNGSLKVIDAEAHESPIEVGQILYPSEDGWDGVTAQEEAACKTWKLIIRWETS